MNVVLSYCMIINSVTEVYSVCLLRNKSAGYFPKSKKVFLSFDELLLGWPNEQGEIHMIRQT